MTNRENIQLFFKLLRQHLDIISFGAEVSAHPIWSLVGIYQMTKALTPNQTVDLATPPS